MTDTIDRLIRRSEVEERTGLCTSSIYRLMRAGEFPEPVKISAKAVRWHYAEIENWMASLPRATGQVAA